MLYLLCRVMMLATGSAGERRVTVFGSSSSVMARSTVQQNMRLYHQVRYTMSEKYLKELEFID